MKTTNPALLDALADCLEAGDPIPEALAKIALAGRAAAAWTQRVGRSVRAGAPFAAALRASGVLDDAEDSLFSAEGAATTPPLLRALAARRRRHLARRRAILVGLVGPFFVGVVTVLLDPITNLVGGGSYLWPAVRGLVLFLLATAAIVVGVPAMLRSPRVGPGVLRVSAALPGAGWIAAQYAEEELTTSLAPFASGGDVSSAGMTAAAALLAWSPLGDTLRVAGRRPEPPSPSVARSSMGGLEPLAPRLSVDTCLAIVGGVAQCQLASRLAARGEAIATVLTARVRTLVRVVAYGLVLVYSLFSLGSMITRGLPGMPMIPGGTPSADAKELEELMKQLEAP